MRTRELADVKSGIAVPGKERSGSCHLLDMVLVWTISNSSSPLMCKAVEGRGDVKLQHQGLCLVVGKRSVCFMFSD